MKKLTHVSLFTGIGGLDLAAEWAGFETVGQCEWADYPTRVLEKHWPNVPRWRDIRELSANEFYRRTGIGPGGVTVLSGGFPCQPFSVAGKRGGTEDDRYLWPEMLRVIKDLRPAWVVGENVPGIIRLALDQVLSDLEAADYSCQAFIIPACAVDAPHRRDRVAIVGWNTNSVVQGPFCPLPGGQCPEPRGVCGTISNPNHQRRKKQYFPAKPTEQKLTGRSYYPGNVADTDSRIGKRFIGRKYAVRPTECDWWTAEPDVGRVAYGVPDRVDRLKALGNAVVPQQFYPIFKDITEVENENYTSIPK